MSEQLRVGEFTAGGKTESCGVSVTLNELEAEVATVVGTRRTTSSRARGLRRQFATNESEGLKLDQDAAGAELAGSRITKCRWNMTCGDDLNEPDLWPNVEVRHTTRENGGLIIRPRDKDGRIFLLVVGTMPNYRVVGWIRSEDAKQERYGWEDVWKVPQSDLRPPPAP